MKNLDSTRASCANSGHSTGPRTEEGKAASAQNSRKHGFCSFAILANEDAAAFRTLQAELAEEYQPSTMSEVLLVDHIATNQWLLERVRRHEAFAMHEDPMMTNHQRFALFHRYTTTYFRAQMKALETLRRMQRDRPAGFVPQNAATQAAATASATPADALTPPEPALRNASLRRS